MYTAENKIAKPVKFSEMRVGTYFILDLTSQNVFFKPNIDHIFGIEAKRAVSHERLCVNLKNSSFEFMQIDAMVYPVNVNIKVDILFKE